MDNLKIYLWALMHSEQFSLCYFRLPIQVGVRNSYEWGVYGRVLWIAFVIPHLYVPYEVKQQYWAAQCGASTFDELPF